MEKKPYYLYETTHYSCGDDDCGCLNINYRLSKDWKPYTTTYEDNNRMITDDSQFISLEDATEFLLNVEYNKKVAMYTTRWFDETINFNNYDYIIIDGYSSDGFDEYFYILNKKEYKNNLLLENINKDNIKTTFPPRKEPYETYIDLFKFVSGTEIDETFENLW